jgi:hypothetical protein
MQRWRQPNKVAAIANLIGESGETVKQPLPDFSARYIPQSSTTAISVGVAHMSLTWGNAGFYAVVLSTTHYPQPLHLHSLVAPTNILGLCL